MEVSPKGLARSQSRRGSYGLCLSGLDDAHPYLAPVDEADPEVHVVRRSGPAAEQMMMISEDRAQLPLSDGGSSASMSRSDDDIRVHLVRPYPDEALLHPLLSTCFVVRNWWHGRDAFHAGAFVVGDRAWVVLGNRGQGKSSLMASLASAGFAVLCDDVVVEVDGYVRAGPGFVDLRSDAARHFPAARAVGRLGSRERVRFDVGARPSQAPLGGWLSLAWGERTELVRTPGPERIPLLLANRALQLAPARPEQILSCAARPFFELRRPKTWQAMADVLALLTALSDEESRGPTGAHES